MRAALLEAIPTEHLPVRVLADPEPGPGQLLLDVTACGICGTDLHILEGRSYRPRLPFVLGHEPVGRVVRLWGLLIASSELSGRPRMSASIRVANRLAMP